ncbi:unnamed protein product [Paramecium octaurelia]|uniref:Uncharacterized protein n=1 Tax=Paramecium octaurelia TaxID=43137 RepID=A0A8S1RY82_PAROT|nr:unnamed protein product [Paramecium octaurelia]
MRLLKMRYRSVHVQVKACIVIKTQLQLNNIFINIICIKYSEQSR